MHVGRRAVVELQRLDSRPAFDGKDPILRSRAAEDKRWQQDVMDARGRL